MSDKNTSTLQSMYDSAASTVQSAIASVTGNPADQREANKTQAKADARDDLSHTNAKIGPFSVSSEGGVAQDDPNRTTGSWNQTVGSAKEAVGNLVGAEGLKQSGRQQNEEGQAQEAQGRLSDLGKGVSDRVAGSVGGAVTGALGLDADKKEYEQRHDEGKARQRGVESDVQKEIDSQQQH